MMPPRDMDMVPLHDALGMVTPYLIPALILAPLLLCVLAVLFECARKSVTRMQNKVSFFVPDDAPRNQRRAELMMPHSTQSFRKGQR